MGPIDVHLQRLRERFLDATWREQPGLGYVITLPQVSLPAGWNKQSCRVAFVAPQGYPYAKPDCFWTDQDLRLASRPGAPPQNTGQSPVAPELASMLWFSWHTDHWNASRDDLLTWVASIRVRLSRLS